MNVLRPVLLGVAAWMALMALPSFGDEDYMTPQYPPGDPRAKMKTLNEIEPRETISALPYPITNSGAYYLTKSLPGSNGCDGIVILADDVKLDLNGFALNGVPGSWNGIIVGGPSHHNITIRNGVVRGWGGCGIAASNANESILENVTAFTNLADGLVVGENSVVRNCGAFKNVGNGLSIGKDGTVANCKMRDNGKNGITAGFSSKIDDCTANHNTMAGVNVSDYCTVRDCTTVENTGPGIKVASQCRIVGNNSGGNGYAGVEVLGVNNRIEDNSVASNQWGIFVEGSGRGNLMIRNSAGGSSVQDYRSVSSNDYFGFIVRTNDMSTAGSGFTNSNPWSNFRL